MAGQESLRSRSRSTANQLHVGLAVRKEIRGRAAGCRQPRIDLAQPIVDVLLPSLGRDRAMAVVTAVLTAVAGPPGAAASCVMFELVNQQEWAAKVAAELGSLTAGDICRSGVRDTPPPLDQPESH
jgi:hypothetical protein